MKIMSVVGARPNFMKIAPFIRAIDRHNSTEGGGMIQHILVHTGQHYDDRMSGKFFKDLKIPEPEINLGVGSGSHAEQVGRTMIEFEKIIIRIQPDWVVVVGDVNATLACSITAKKENVKLCHIEAGLRSGDIAMPEEINRMVTDRLADLLLTPDRISIENLKKEGIPPSKIGFVGNIMIDTLDENLQKAAILNIEQIVEDNLIGDSYHANKSSFNSGNFALITMHRPSNVDIPEVLMKISNFLVEEVSTVMTLIWTIHPRTLEQLKHNNLFQKIVKTENIVLLQPLDYVSMLKLNMAAILVLTDSGGLQEECTVLGTPCITLRYNTERPVTLKENGGVSVLTGHDIPKIRVEFEIAANSKKIPVRPELWDGNTADRCLKAILNYSL